MLSIGWAVFFALLSIVAFVVSFVGIARPIKKSLRYGSLMSVVGTIITFVLACVVTVPPGHMGVAVLFGDVQESPISSGMHLANPLLEWRNYDCRQKTHLEQASVPSVDQLLTTIDVSIQYKVIASATPKMLDETGTVEDVINIHLIPMFRSTLREVGKTVLVAEDFFLEATQQRIQVKLLTVMQATMRPQGIDVSAILLRNIVLPPTIREGVEAKKKRDQEAEKQKSELRRFTTEQQQKVAQARAEKDAAKERAEMVMVLADAKAYEIKKINEAISGNPAYIKLEALKALQSISKDPAAKLYFLNGDSPTPLPLMHLGDIGTK